MGFRSKPPAAMSSVGGVGIENTRAKRGGGAGPAGAIPIHRLRLDIDKVIQIGEVARSLRDKRIGGLFRNRISAAYFTGSAG